MNILLVNTRHFFTTNIFSKLHINIIILLINATDMCKNITSKIYNFITGNLENRSAESNRLAQKALK